MKKWNLLLGSILATGILTFGITSCGEVKKPQENVPSIPGSNKPSGSDGIKDDEDLKAKFGCLTVSEALSKAPNESTNIKIYGIVKTIINQDNGNILIKDNSNNKELKAVNISNWSSFNRTPEVNDEIVFEGSIVGSGNSKLLRNAKILAFRPYKGTTPTPTPDEDQDLATKHNCITLSEAIEKATKAGEAGTKDSFNVYGKIEKITSAEWGNLVIKDSTAELFVFGLQGWKTMTNKPEVGDEVVLNGTLQTHKNKEGKESPQIFEPSLVEIKKANGEGGEITPEPDVDDSAYQEATVSAARALDVGTKVKLTGVVANITNNGKGAKSNFFLVDNTGSINVHSDEVAAKIAIGNKVTILAERSNYISSRETSSAAKHGYKGSIQVTNAKLVSNDNGNHDFDKTWIKKSTMKELIETPVTEPITTLIYKVKGFIHKKPGNGFTNYDINDLDDKTGSYTYSQNNGKDFAWLDKFDNKLCDIYVSPINCKSTSSSCYFRFVPIQVNETNKAVDDEDVPQFVLDYYVKDELKDLYESNPELVLPTNISDTKLGFENCAITYSSSNENAIKFVKEGENVALNALADGTSKITIKATFNEFSATLIKDITVKNKTVTNSIGVKEAILKDDNTEVIVKGIVQASLLTKRGFYLADDTGVIAVLVKSDDILRDLKIGDEVYMKGIKTHPASSVDETHVGQICIDDAVVELNAYGRHELVKTSYDTTKTITDLVGIDVMTDATTQVYTTKALVEYVNGGYSVNVYLKDPDDPTKSLFIYNSNGGEVEDFKNFNGKEITIDVALCNWNKKENYRAAVLSFTDGTTTIVCDHFLKK